ncbi:hypothetical protein DPEC_G00041280 [Dallia pectoralis]|uniref:Uncharacterized protein n=1 Tax=Dallia pectoralis TaxID=75939 RepID=A0ACC2HFU8_DALPE|nr:hypothetical protein DPEC_G00041280 [Dallia pectoralis]
MNALQKVNHKAQQTMQDDLLMGKNKGQPHQQPDPTVDPASTPTPSDPHTSEESPSGLSNQAASALNRDKVLMESPILPALSFHQPLETGGTVSPSFGSTWSTGTTNTVDDTFFQGIPSVNGTMLFQNFPHHVNPVFGGNFSPQLGLAQSHPEQPRRSPVSLNQGPFPQRTAYGHQSVMNSKALSSASSSGWNNHQNAAWSSASNPWTGLHTDRDPRRAVGGVGVGVSAMNPISPMKKPFSSNVIAPPKPPRAAPLTQKSWMDDNAFRTDNSNNMLPFQDRNRPFDAFSLHSLENSLMDMIRTDHEKGRMGLSFHHPGADHILPLNNEITNSFRRYGHLVVDWPHKAESKSYFPPKGYAFLLFQEETSVQALIDACMEEDGKLYLCVSSPTIKDKPVQIRPWNLSDSDFVMDGSQPLDPRKTIFVGGVPRPLRAVELAMIMDRLYGGVCYAGIDTDPELKYPKGAGRVAFSNQQSYIAAISARFVQLQHNDIDKRVEVKPYVLDDQMCDECQGGRCGGKFAPFFCANVTCLQYYCEFCWASIHSRAGREFHKPLVKEGGDRPRHVSFRWS